MEKRVQLIALLMALIFTGAVLAQGTGKVVGSKQAKKYHREDCAQVKKISKDNLVEFASAAEAKAKGYSPFKICKPEEPKALKEVKETKKGAVKEAAAAKKEALKEAAEGKTKVEKKGTDVKKKAVETKKEAYKDANTLKKEAVKSAQDIKKETKK